MSTLIETPPIARDPEFHAGQVSWQTALTILFGLLANVMAQPCGRVCGAPKLYSPYLRSSPIVCVIDSLTLICHIIVNAIKRPKRQFRSALNEIVRARYEVDARTHGEFTSVQSQTGLRLILFILAGLLPFVKLAGMRGIAGTQAIAIMFMSSLAVQEIFIVSAVSYCVVENASLPPPSAHGHNISLPSEARKWERFIGATSHMLLMIWAASRIWSRGFVDLVLLCMSAPMNFGVIVEGAELVARALRSREPWKEISEDLSKLENWIIPLAMVYIQWMRVWLAPMDGLDYLFSWMFPIDIAISITILAIPFFLALLIMISSLYFVRLGQNLLVLDPSETDKNEDNFEACLAATFFLVNVIAVTLWYCRCYDPWGTFNPPWTNLLG